MPRGLSLDFKVCLWWRNCILYIGVRVEFFNSYCVGFYFMGPLYLLRKKSLALLSPRKCMDWGREACGKTKSGRILLQLWWGNWEPGRENLTAGYRIQCSCTQANHRRIARATSREGSGVSLKIREELGRDNKTPHPQVHALVEKRGSRTRDYRRSVRPVNLCVVHQYLGEN